jgi:outer membrane protein OmpA-like peptidoglycan-associated protein
MIVVLMVISLALAYRSLRNTMEPVPPQPQGSVMTKAPAPSIPDRAMGVCTQIVHELRELPEIEFLLPHPGSCTIYRAQIPAGEILAAPGIYRAITEESPPYDKLERNKIAELLTLKSAETSLTNAGWHLDPENRFTTHDGINEPIHAEYWRVLPDKTRQYVLLDNSGRMKLSIISLPAPKITLHLPDPGIFPSRVPSRSETQFPELPPSPGLIQQRFFYGMTEQYSTDEDPVTKRPSYGWWAPRWERTYRYDSTKQSALAVALLYKDALREAGWSVGHNYYFDFAPQSGNVDAKTWDRDRELIAHVSIQGDGNASISLTDIAFQRKVAALKQQWKQFCIATVPRLEFPPNGNTLSDAAQLALHVLLEAYRTEAKGANDVEVALELRGRADPTGNRKKNLMLAAARAENVKAWLVDHEIPANNLSIRSFGDWESGAKNESLPIRTVSVAKLACSPIDSK